MSQQHPITPPPELVGQWLYSEDYQWGPLEQKSITITTNQLQNVATQAARWGAYQELEATLGLMATLNIRGVDYVRNARRSARAPSLKKSALHELADVYDRDKIDDSTYDTIRRALEALDD